MKEKLLNAWKSFSSFVVKLFFKVKPYVIKFFIFLKLQIKKFISWSMTLDIKKRIVLYASIGVFTLFLIVAPFIFNNQPNNNNGIIDDSNFVETNSGESLNDSYTILYNGDITEGSIETLGERVFYKFTPQKTARYEIESIGLMDTVAMLYDENQDFLATFDSGGALMNFKITYDFIKDRTYYIQVQAYSDNSTGTFGMKNPVEVAVLLGDSFASAIQAQVGTNNVHLDTVGQYAYFVFSVSETREYIISSQGEYDTFATLYNSIYEGLYSHDDNYSDANFRIPYTLVKGETYYLRIHKFGSQTNIDFTFTIS